MRLRVDPDLCTVCGLCADLCPELFIVEDDVAEAVDGDVDAESEECAREAVDACPVEAISLEE